jgi:large subunit ribosomal protein L6
MSRIGKRPVAIPQGVTVKLEAGALHVKGPKGTLVQPLPRGIQASLEEGRVVLRRPDDRKPTRALHGLARALVANTVRGVTELFQRDLEIQGVGYRAEVQGKKLVLNVGYSHPVPLEVPEGIKVAVERNVLIKIEGADRQRVGQFAADVRSVRPARALQGQGHPLRGRARAAQGRQGRRDGGWLRSPCTGSSATRNSASTARAGPACSGASRARAACA